MIIIAVAAMSTGAVAQEKGDAAIGANLLTGSGSGYTNVGIGAKFLYNVTDPVRMSAEFDYFLKKDNVSMWDFSAYVHYLIPVVDRFTLYPSVGLGLINTKVSGDAISGSLGESGNILGIDISESSASSNDFAFSVGGGADYELTDNLVLNGGFRYKVKNNGRLNIVAGIAYKF
jgi:outer membrane protein X